MTAITAYRVSPGSNELEPVELEQDEGDTTYLKALYGSIECKYVEMMSFGDGLVLFVDEEGMYNGKAPNAFLLSLVEELGGGSHSFKGAGVYSAANSSGASKSMNEKQLTRLTEAQAKVLS